MEEENYTKQEIYNIGVRTGLSFVISNKKKVDAMCKDLRYEYEPNYFKDDHTSHVTQCKIGLELPVEEFSCMVGVDGNIFIVRTEQQVLECIVYLHKNHPDYKCSVKKYEIWMPKLRLKEYWENNIYKALNPDPELLAADEYDMKYGIVKSRRIYLAKQVYYQNSLNLD